MKVKVVSVIAIIIVAQILLSGCSVMIKDTKVLSSKSGNIDKINNEIVSKLDLSVFGIEKLSLPPMDAKLLSENIENQNTGRTNECVNYSALINNVTQKEFILLLKFIVLDLKINCNIDGISNQLQVINEENIQCSYNKQSDNKISFFALKEHNNKYVQSSLLLNDDKLLFALTLKNNID
ncbi:MAG: hypothetical protein RR334_03455 [Clostridia bacterium]